MTERWFTENWTQLMSGPDELIAEIRQQAAKLSNETVNALLQDAEQQRAEAEASLQEFGLQRQKLLATLDALQSELAVAGRPLQGEIS